MSWKPEVLVRGEWGQNALVFATKKEAEMSARDIFERWMLAENSRAVESDEPVNYELVIKDGNWVMNAVGQKEPEHA